MDSEFRLCDVSGSVMVVVVVVVVVVAVIVVAVIVVAAIVVAVLLVGLEVIVEFEAPHQPS